MTQNPTPDPSLAPSSSSETKKPEVDFGNPLEEEKILIAWKAPERLHKTRGKEFFTTVGAFVFLLSIIALFFKEILLMITIWAFAFVSIAMSKTKPASIDYAITTRGLKIGKNKYRFSELARFWLEEKLGKIILYIDTFRPFPGRLAVILEPIDKDKIKAILVKKIPYDKPEDTFVDKAGKWLSEKVPLEEPNGAPGRT
ncbi:hypothetical protein HYU89_01260 [Candidatus Collierbacteria bacterium]|nr:hypothetical protein [Candidatus Collierbacteria bacterium]